jgi:hypothetical protein
MEGYPLSTVFFSKKAQQARSSRIFIMCIIKLTTNSGPVRGRESHPSQSSRPQKKDEQNSLTTAVSYQTPQTSETAAQILAVSRQAASPASLLPDYS